MANSKSGNYRLLSLLRGPCVGFKSCKSLPCRADSRFAPSQWETSLHCNDVSHWLGASLESVLPWTDASQSKFCIIRQNRHQLSRPIFSRFSCGGNMLLNVGPTHDGRIVPIFEERLRQMGEWLNVNGPAIYKTKPWTHQNDTITPKIWRVWSCQMFPMKSFIIF